MTNLSRFWSGLGSRFNRRRQPNAQQEALASETADVLADIALISPIALITDETEMGLVSAGLAISSIGDAGKAMGLSTSAEWTGSQWRECARAALATSMSIGNVDRLKRIETCKLQFADQRAADYLNRLTEIAYDNLVAVLKGSDRLKDSPVVKRWLAAGTSSLLKMWGNKSAAEGATSLVLLLVSTNVIRKVAAMAS